MIWTDDTDMVILTMYGRDGASYRTIADAVAALGDDGEPNRSMIAGRLHRLLTDYGIRKPLPQMEVEPEKPRPENRRTGQGLSNWSRPAPEERQPPIFLHLEPDPVVTDGGVPYMRNPPNGCKAVLDQRGEFDLPYVCGQERVFLSPYCAQHNKLYNRRV